MSKDSKIHIRLRKKIVLKEKIKLIAVDTALLIRRIVQSQQSKRGLFKILTLSLQLCRMKIKEIIKSATICSRSTNYLIKNKNTLFQEIKVEESRLLLS